MSDNPDMTEAPSPTPAMSVRGAAIWAMASQYLAFALQFASSVLISRFFLTPAEVGLFSIAMAAALLVAVLQDFGLSRYISGLPRLEHAEIERCSSIALLFSLLVAGVVMALAWPLARLYAMPDLAPLLVVIGSSYFFLPLAIVPLALMARDMQFRGHFAVNVGGACAQAGVALGLAAAGYSSFALAWATVASGLARGTIAQILRPALPRRLHLTGSGAVFAFGTRSSALYVSGALGTRSPDMVVGKLLSLSAVGLYSRAVSLSDQFQMLISGAIGSVLYPAFARIRDRGEALGPAYLRVCAGYSAIVWPGMTGLSLAALPIVRMLYGESWLGVAPLLSLVAFNATLHIALPMVSEVPILLGRMNRLLAYNVIDTALSIGLLALGCLWGVEGAAASRLVYGVLWLALYFGFMHRLVGFAVSDWLKLYAKSLAGTLAALAPLTLAYLFWHGPQTITFGPLLACVLTGVLCWLLALLLVRHPVLGEFYGMARGIRLPVLQRAIAPETRLGALLEKM
ncbi:oligosaccharide flippase family protein [Novosphingobium profundi]|uniref:oligosaccharide flippase family protein n=1 Tax=Novosphingobium profundi TaxID=1774954 RepID=UPI001FE26DFC|nr:oligosaccharide flippase family protein [Novosphingobium profundi]